jgi:hypothetical protein
MTDGRKPIKQFRSGGVKAAVWENQFIDKEGEKKEFRNVTLTRSYKKGDSWENSHSFGIRDLPKAVLVLQKAYEFLALQEQLKPDGVENENDNII